MVIQRILRHANVSTTATYYIKTAAGDVRNAMAMLEDHIGQAARATTRTEKSAYGFISRDSFAFRTGRLAGSQTANHSERRSSSTTAFSCP